MPVRAPLSTPLMHNHQEARLRRGCVLAPTPWVGGYTAGRGGLGSSGEAPSALFPGWPRLRALLRLWLGDLYKPRRVPCAGAAAAIGAMTAVLNHVQSCLDAVADDEELPRSYASWVPGYQDSSAGVAVLVQAESSTPAHSKSYQQRPAPTAGSSSCVVDGGAPLCPLQRLPPSGDPARQLAFEERLAPAAAAEAAVNSTSP